MTTMCPSPKGSSVRQGEPQRRTDAGELGGEPPLIFRTKAQMVYEQLRDWIVRGKLQPGESVDQERLAGMLAVKGAAVRDDDLTAQLTETSARMAEAVESADNEGFVMLDRLFHMSLYKA